MYLFSSGTPPYESRICLQDSSGAETPNSQSVKGEEELTRVYQTLTLPAISRDDNSSNNNRFEISQRQYLLLLTA